MRLDIEQYNQIVHLFHNSAMAQFGPASSEVIAWMTKQKLPKELIEMLKKTSPKSELWAGAGAIFKEEDFLKWNEDYPEALKAGLFIIGSAANGDYICMDLNSGEVGYLSYEHSWKRSPKRYFASVSPSIGRFLSDSNAEDSDLPDDYWEAKAKTR